MPHEPPLREEVRRQLHRAAEPGPYHGGAYAPVQAAEPLGLVDLRHAVGRVPVLVLGADGQERAVALQPRLDEEEGAARGGADDARGGAAEHVDAEVLLGAVAQQQGGEAVAHGLVEAEAAAVEEDLVDVRAPDAAVDALEALVPHDDADAVEGAPVVVRLVAFGLELALELHSISQRGFRVSPSGFLSRPRNMTIPSDSRLCRRMTFRYVENRSVGVS